MAHLYKASEWELGGVYHVTDSSESIKTSVAGLWYTPMEIFGLTKEEYIKMLETKYHAIDIEYSEKYDMLLFNFKTLAEARKFKNDLNKKARQIQYIC